MTKRALVLAAALACTACGKEAPTPTGLIDRETFIATYVDLRNAALKEQYQVLTDEGRDRILKEHGVTEEELLAFADARGSDPAYMVKLWDEVRARMAPDAAARADSASSPGQ